ncbi:hypothetical protein [Undibacterium sp. Tian12W]
MLQKSYVFKSRADCAECEQAIDLALGNKEIKSIPEPSWYAPPIDEMGQAVFFEKINDGSVWVLVLPERVSFGYWKQIK